MILDELSLKGKKLGIEYEAYGLTGRNALRLNKSLENYCTVEDKSDLITKLRVVKSKEEIVYVKKAAELADCSELCMSAFVLLLPVVGDQNIQLFPDETIHNPNMGIQPRYPRLR